LELLVKERLTGAIILVVLIVLLVPELLSGPKGPAATPPAAGAASPSSEEPPLRSYTINLGDDSHTQSETANGAAGSSGPPQPETTSPQPTQPAQPTTQAATPGKDLAESSSWDSSTTTAQNSAPPVVETQPSPPAPKPVPKLKPAAPAPKANQPAPNVAARAEPAARTAAADKATAMPHTTPAPAASESGGLVVSGWAVQLGVFASKENAERLALDVRTKGFKASVSPVTSGKRKLYRVRVGPAADKSAAQDLQSKLKAAGRPGGAVVPYS
jgi:cell division septation protein DedD